ADLVIDHSVQVDTFGTLRSLHDNMELEFQRNQERYQFLKWGQTAFKGFRVVPPGTGIVHQVNLEYLAQVVFVGERDGKKVAYPDTLVGTDSHTTMINGLGVLGWGVGGIEAEAAMLGQPTTMLIPQVVGFRLSGQLPEGATATDLVLTVTEMLRKKGVVGKFVEFFGAGVAALSLADRATIANMAPEYGATCGIFPVDAETLRYLSFSGRAPDQVALVEAYAREQGMFHEAGSAEAEYTDVVDLDLASVEPSVAGPKRPQDRVSLYRAKRSFEDALPTLAKPKKPEKKLSSKTNIGFAPLGEALPDVNNGSVVIAAITSCTNTSNPSVLIAAGLVAKKAVEKGLSTKPWVKTSLAPGSKVVTEYLAEAGLTPYLEKLKFHTVGYGCTTCIGNSGPLPAEISAAVEEKDLAVCAVLSGNRNFEGRINQDVKANYLASPPLVVAYALAGRMDLDLTSEPLGEGSDGEPVFLRDVWPDAAEVKELVGRSIASEMFTRNYGEVFSGDEIWKAVEVPEGDRYTWPDSTYVRRPSFFEGMPAEAPGVEPIKRARVLALLGDSITTDHISPAGAIKKDSPAGRWLVEQGVEPRDFNSYGSRRGNHEVMIRGTFANIRLRNLLVERAGGFTRHFPDGGEATIYEAAMAYASEGVPLVVLAGKEYGSGSSRDWAAKGAKLLGVRATIAESFERIHRSNLIGMGVLPLQFPAGESAESLGLTGEEVFDIGDLEDGAAKSVTVTAGEIEFEATVRLDTPNEVAYFRNGGILQTVLRNLRN
ncbi:MAG TPA: aconitate hydratase AcnA, partial [Solirubrobacterales bacterium]|nr:aconitate hydratase AcnA [Solirubrobacterales bacterium]